MSRPAKTSGLCRRGAVVVETAIVLFVLFLLLFGIFEYGRLLMTLNVAENAARTGARLAAVQFTANRTTAEIDALTTGVIDETRSAMGGVDRQIESCLIEVVRVDPITGADAGSWTSARFAEPIAVRVTGNYRPALRLFLPDTVPVRVQAFMASEAN